MRRLLVARLWQSLIVVLLATTISFFLIRAAPGDPFSFTDGRMTPAYQAEMRRSFGYDRPLIEQYVRYMGNVAHGNFGWSVTFHDSVANVLAAAVPRTLLLTGIGLAISLLLGVVVGVQQAARAGGAFDRISSTVFLWLYSLPDFWAALMMILLFSYTWRLFPAGGMVETAMHEYYTPWEAFVDRLKHLVLPVLTIVALMTAGVARFQRAAVLEALPGEYIRTARAKGVSERQIVWRHAVRNSLAPMVTVFGLMLPALLGGSVFVEWVFAWPGMGLLAAKSVGNRDYDVVTAIVIIGALIVVIGNTLADLLHMALDPRVRDQ